MVKLPVTEGVHAKVQFVVPDAASQVFPPSTETSTWAIPLSSDAVPVTVRTEPWVMDAPFNGLVITDTGPALSI
jgi:hypothetical protein